MGAHGTAAVVNVCAIIGCCGFRASKRSAQRGAERNGARQGRGGGGAIAERTTWAGTTGDGVRFRKMAPR